MQTAPQQDQESENWLESLAEIAWDYNNLEEALRVVDTTDREENPELIEAAEKILSEAAPLVEQTHQINEATPYKTLKTLKQTIIDAKVMILMSFRGVAFLT